MAIMVSLIGVMLVVSSCALCAAGAQRGEARMLERVRSTLIDARVIEPETSSKSSRRRQAAELNRTAYQSVELRAIPEEPSRQGQPPSVPTRTYSLRYFNPALANMKRRMSAALVGANLIDLSNDVPVSNPSLKPEEEGDWV